MPDFGTYDKRPVRQSSLKITGTGDGLSDALAIEPQDWHPKDTAFIVLEIEMGDVNYKYVEKGDCWNRVQGSKAIRGAFISSELAVPLLDDVKVAFEEQRQAEGGDVELDLDGEVGPGRMIEHERGLHKRKRKDCPACQGTATDQQYAEAQEAITTDEVGKARAKRTRKPKA